MKYAVIAAAAALLFTPLLFAADAKKEDAAKGSPKKEKSAAEPKETGMHLPFKGTVVAVTPRTLTLNAAEGKEGRKFKTNKETEILKGEVKASVEDIKTGMEVTGSFVRDGDTDTITKLQLQPAKDAK